MTLLRVVAYFILIRGSLGIGKSTIAKRLSKILNAGYFAVDRVLDEHDLTKEWEEGYISQKSFLKANKIIIPKAKKLLDKGALVIFDGNFYWKSQIDDLIKKLDYPSYIFTLKAPLDVCIERDSKRKKAHGKDAAMAVYKKSTEFDCGKSIDISKKSINQAVKEILSYLPKP